MNLLSSGKKIYSYLLCFIFIINNYSSGAQNSGFPFPAFQNINTRDGLSNNNSFMVLQDSKGFIWITTNYGLNRYDGYNFKIYNYDAADSNSLSSSWYRSLFEDKNGIIWILSSTHGFFSFDPAKEKFMRYAHEPGNSNSLADNANDGNLLQDSSGIIWISTFSGLNSFDPVSKKFEFYSHHENDKTTLSANDIWWICTDEENNLWVVTELHVDVFNLSTKKVTASYSIGSPEMPGDKNHPFLYGLSQGKNGNIWIGSESNGLYGYNTRTKKWIHFTHDPNNPFSFKTVGAQTGFEDNEGNLFIPPVDNGVFYYEAASGKFFHSALTGDNDSYENIVNVMIDQSGKIWMAGQYKGLHTLDPVFKNIHIVQHNPNDKNSIASNVVIALYRTKNGDLFMGGEKAVYIINSKNEKPKQFEIFENGENVFSNNTTWQIREDNNGTLWFCTIGGLISYNQKTKKHHWYRHDEIDSTSLSTPSATSMIIDNKGRYWVTTFGGGLDLFNPETGKFKAFKVHSGKNSISSNLTAFITKDSKGNIYCGSWYGGLIKFDPDKETFKIFRHNPSDSTSISCDIVIPLYEAENGIFWIGTVGGGLNAFDPATEKFKTFSMKDGLPSNAVVSLVNDDSSKTWLGTYHGLSCCMLPKNPFEKNCKIKFRNYDVSDGLPINDMYVKGAHKEPDGTLVFTTNNGGLFYFNPDEFTDNKFIPPVYITQIDLLNRPLLLNDKTGILKTVVEQTKEIVLSYKQNIISFTFSALNYIHPEKNKYAYQLSGYDKDWIYADATKRFATYTNIDPGEYIFKVKGSNNDGVWNEKPTELKIIITPPFWQTVWFKVLVAITIVCASFAFYRYRIGQILLLQRIRNKIASDLHDDIGSTLNSISVFSEVAKKDSSRREHALNMIGESSRRVIESMSDIVWSINPENDNFDKIIFRMRSLTHNILKAKKIDCTFRADESLNELKLPMQIRRNFYLIFKEALNNLVKYSNATRVSVLVSQQNKNVTFIIRDDGVGFDNTIEHSGNGLSNMKKRAAEIGAMLLIESALEKGTSIELNLKL